MTAAPIDKESAIEIAKRSAALHGYPWLEPMSAVEGEDEIEVSTNADVLGGNVVVVIDRITGDVRSVESFDR